MFSNNDQLDCHSLPSLGCSGLVLCHLDLEKYI